MADEAAKNYRRVTVELDQAAHIAKVLKKDVDDNLPEYTKDLTVLHEKLGWQIMWQGIAQDLSEEKDLGDDGEVKPKGRSMPPPAANKPVQKKEQEVKPAT